MNFYSSGISGLSKAEQELIEASRRQKAGYYTSESEKLAEQKYAGLSEQEAILAAAQKREYPNLIKKHQHR